MKERCGESALVVVDNTMMSPYLQRPLEFGADVVYDSGTKYLSGHHDLMAGVVGVRDETLGDVSVPEIWFLIWFGFLGFLLLFGHSYRL